jgi:hypothetical protein
VSEIIFGTFISSNQVNMSTDLITLLANLALTLSLIVAVIFGIVQVNTTRKDRRERLTLEALRNFQSREFAGLLLLTSSNKFPANMDEWGSWPNEDREKFIQLLQLMESLGILLADKLINYELVDKTLGSYVTTLWERFKPLVMDMRQNLPDPFMSEYFQWMAQQIEKRMRDNPRKPYFESHTDMPKR